MQEDEGRFRTAAGRKGELDLPTCEGEEQRGDREQAGQREKKPRVQRLSESEELERPKHAENLADKLQSVFVDLRRLRRRSGEEAADEAAEVAWYWKPGLAVLGAIVGAIAGSLLGLAGVAGGTFLGAAVGTKLGARIGGFFPQSKGGSPKETGIRKRRGSMDEPDVNL